MDLRDIEATNELIARFMELPNEKVGLNRMYFYPGDGYSYTVEQLLYSKSWDWLMPVVEKIEQTHDTGIFYDGKRGPDFHNIRVYTKRGGSDTITIAYGTSKIECVYCAVVEFIKWYNENK